MICDFDRIDALCAGELTDEERASVLTHIDTCPACRAYYEAMAGLEGEDTAPENFTARVMDAVRATPQVKVRRKSPVWQGVAAMAACAALVVGLGFGSGLLSPEMAPADGTAAELSRGSDDGEAVPAGEGNEAEGDAAAPEGYAADGGDQASDLPLTVHTLTDEALCTQVRTWLVQQGIPQLYPDGQREAYDLTVEQVEALNRDIPLLELPHQMLQLELKSAE